MSTRTDALSSKEVGKLISTSQMLLYNLISPIEMKQGLITDKKAPHLNAYKEKGKGEHLAFLIGASSPCAGDGKPSVLACAPRVYLCGCNYSRACDFSGRNQGWEDRRISVT